MATTIRIDNNLKNRMDRLKAILLLNGVKLTQAELIEFMIKETEKNIIRDENELNPNIGKQFLIEAEKIKFNGGESSYKTIDEELYGE